MKIQVGNQLQKVYPKSIIQYIEQKENHLYYEVETQPKNQPKNCLPVRVEIDNEDDDWWVQELTSGSWKNSNIISL